MQSKYSDSDIGEILNYLKKLESRIEHLEKYLGRAGGTEKEASITETVLVREEAESTDALEFKIGQFWFAKAGIVVLAIGIVLALTFPYERFPAYLPGVIGFGFVAAILFLSNLFRHSYNLISRYLFGGGLLLTYFSTLRLAFFSPEPVLQNKIILVLLLLLVVVIFLVAAIKRKSIYLSGIALFLGYTTALVSEHPLTLFCLVLLFSVVSIYLSFNYDWMRLLNFGIILTYLTHFFWFINNPFLGNTLQLVSSPGYNLVFILLYATAFAVGNLFRSREIQEDSLISSASLLNCFGGLSLLFLASVTMFNTYMAIYHFIASVLFILISALFWIREKSKYSTFFYAIAGYTALSIAIITQFPKPQFFVWLCWQSLLVISTAIWFRSKIIVLANFIIYLIIFVAYLITVGKADIIGLSFVIVSLVSARIMNWQKDRLELKTEYMRNAYLTTAFIIFPYTLYHAVPSGFVAISWVGIALFYYAFSVILKNKKYRLMALFTLLLTIGYIVIIGTIRLEPIYRIISFLLLGVVLLVISLVYTKLRNKSSSGTHSSEKGKIVNEIS